MNYVYVLLGVTENSNAYESDYRTALAASNKESTLQEHIRSIEESGDSCFTEYEIEQILWLEGSK